MEQNSLNSANSENPLKHEVDQFNCGAVVESLSLTQEIVGSSNLFKKKKILSLNSLNSMKTFWENSINCVL